MNCSNTVMDSGRGYTMKYVAPTIVKVKVDTNSVFAISGGGHTCDPSVYRSGYDSTLPCGTDIPGSWMNVDADSYAPAGAVCWIEPN